MHNQDLRPLIYVSSKHKYQSAVTFKTEQTATPTVLIKASYIKAL